MIYDLNVRCSNCTRFLKIKASASSEVVMTCDDRKCKADNIIKVVMLSDLYANGHSEDHEHVEDKSDEYKKTIEDLQKQVDELDGRTKEAKELKAQMEDLKKAHETDQSYIQQLEGIIDGQG